MTDVALDRFALYERAVQHPAHEVKLFASLFAGRRGRPLMTLREDFAGTAAVSAAWVASADGRRAWAIDHDDEALTWCRQHHLPTLGAAAERLTLVHDDVRSIDAPPADLVCAENFSYSVFTTRDALRGYFEAARTNLVDDGVFIVDVQGGPAVLREGVTERRVFDGFVMGWEHARFDPVSQRVVFHMHFEVGRQRLARAFTYDWRLWSIPELRELMVEAGFADTEVWWAEGEGRRAGVYRPRREAPAQEHWVAYVVGLR
jgi:hypothetical protein